MYPVNEITAITTLKYAWYVVFIWVFEYLNIPTQQLWFLGILMLIDFISGLMKQYSLDPKEITSHKAWLWAVKKLWTFLVILSLWIFFKAYWIDAKEYLKWVLSIFIWAETYSIIQNIYVMRTGKIIREYDAISIVLKKIWEVIIKMIESFLKK